MAGYLVFKQNDDRSWTELQATDAATADAAIEKTRTTEGTFVAVLIRGFRPRTHYAPPKAASPRKEATL